VPGFPIPPLRGWNRVALYFFLYHQVAKYAPDALAFQNDDVPLVPDVLSPDKCVSGGFGKCQASSYS
jgi:hypothetical protein